MEDEATPEFLAKPIPKKPRRTRASGSKNKPEATEPLPSDVPEGMPAVPRKIERAESAENKKIAEELTAIYREPDGSLPNMKTITIRKNHSLKNILVGILVLGVLAAGGVWVAEFFGIGTPVSPDALLVTVEGDTQSTLGATSTYTISYNNRSENILNNVVLNVYTPAGFVFATSSAPASNAGNNEWRLPPLGPYGRGSITITGLPFGDVGSNASWRVFVHYQPEHFGSTLEAVATLATQLTGSPFAMHVTGPAETVVGAPTVYTYTVDPFTKTPPGKLELVPDLPSNFVISSSSPKLVNNRWSVASPKNTSSSRPFSFTLTGSFSTASGTSTPIGGHLAITLPAAESSYQVASNQIHSTVSENAVIAGLAINGSTTDSEAHPGDSLTISVHVKNSSVRDLKNVKVKLVVDAPAIKKQSVVDWGNIDDVLDGTIVGEQVTDALRRASITWSSKELPYLAKISSGGETTIDIRVPIKSVEAFDQSALTTSTIYATASVTYNDQSNQTQSIAATPIKITMNSDLAFSMRRLDGKTKDNKPQFTLGWVLTNSFHDLENIEVSGNVLGDVSVALAPSSAGTSTYSSTDKKILWQIARLPVSVDLASLPFTVVLNTSNPTQTTLISKIHITATDAVTGRTLSFLSDDLPVIAPTSTPTSTP